MLCGTAGCTEGAKMSGSAGKMGGTEMKEGLKRSLLNKVKVTDKILARISGTGNEYSNSLSGENIK